MEILRLLREYTTYPYAGVKWKCTGKLSQSGSGIMVPLKSVRTLQLSNGACILFFQFIAYICNLKGGLFYISADVLAEYYFVCFHVTKFSHSCCPFINNEDNQVPPEDNLVLKL